MHENVDNKYCVYLFVIVIHPGSFQTIVSQPGKAMESRIGLFVYLTQRQFSDLFLVDCTVMCPIIALCVATL